MKIGINLVTIIPGQIGGIETYTNKTLEWLTKIDKDNEYILFSNSDNHSYYSQYHSDKIKIYPLKGKAQYRFSRLVSVYFRLPYLCWKYNIDVLFSPGNIAPLWLHCKSLLTLHDAVYHDKKAKLDEKIQRFLYSLSALRANSIITVSKSAANDIINFCYAKKDKISVTKQGGGVDENQQVSNEQINALKKQLGVSRYILSLGSLIARKNYPLLIEAFANLTDKTIALVIVGQHGPDSNKIKTTIKKYQLEHRVILSGYFKGSLEVLYRGAEIYVQASTYEGFGIPVLEAMSLEVPVISSNASSLPEVGANAVLYFSPDNSPQLTHQITKLLKNKNLCNELVQKGLQQAKLFSWENNAKNHLNLLKNLVTLK